MQVRTLPELFQRAVHEHGPRTAVRYPRDGDWHPITYGQLGRLVEEAGLGLMAAGIEPGDHVAIVAANGPQAAIAQMASLHAGATVVALGPPGDRAPDRLAEVDLAAAFLDPPLAEDEPWSERESAPETIVELAGSPSRDGDRASVEANSESRISMARLYRQGQRAARRGETLTERVQAIEPTDRAHLVPGPDGAARVLTHDASLTEARAVASIVELAPGERCLSLAGPAEGLHRSAGWHTCLALGAETWLAREPSRVGEHLGACRPELLVAPAGAYAVLRESLEDRLAASAPSQRRLFGWARSVGRRYDRERGADGPGWGLRGNRWVADRLVLGKARAAMGLEQARLALAPGSIAPELAAWLRSIGVPLARAYQPPGAGGLVAVQRPEDPEVASLGRLLPGVEVRIAGDDGEGEIFLRGPLVGRPLSAKGDPEDERHWLQTGDRGRVAEGRLLPADVRDAEGV